MTVIKSLALLSTLLLAVAPRGVAAETAVPPSASQAAGASLQVTFDGMKTPTGRVLAVLFDSEAAYGGQAGPVHALQLEIVDGKAAATVAGLKPGRYALRAVHDVDGDGRMSTNPFGMPTEPFAFSNNAKGRMGPPAWEAAAFDVGPTGAVQTIILD